MSYTNKSNGTSCEVMMINKPGTNGKKMVTKSTAKIMLDDEKTSTVIASTTTNSGVPVTVKDVTKHNS